MNINTYDYIRGTCMEMCSEEEMKTREENNLLHILECIPGTHGKVVHPKRAVKCFSRSAAGKNLENEKNIRPPHVLLQTVGYLLFDITSIEYLPWNIVYEFITDRLMAVRQDVVVQNLTYKDTISILEPIVRFHAYAAYRLCSEAIENFDPFQNNKHLQECLKKLLLEYDICEKCNTESSQRTWYLNYNRPIIEALYLLFNIGKDEALCRTLNLTTKWRSMDIISLAFNISLNFKHRNFVRAAKLIRKLPSFLAAIVALHLPHFRKDFYRILCFAYGLQNNICTFPITFLSDFLLYDANKGVLISNCTDFGLIVENDNLIFTKESFREDVTIKPTHENFVENLLDRENIQSFLLNGNMASCY